MDALLRALAKVRGGFEAVILGDVNQRRSCEKLGRRLGLLDRVTFKGFIPQPQLKEDLFSRMQREPIHRQRFQHPNCS